MCAAALLGACMGSFGSVVAHRLPVMLMRTWGESVVEQDSCLSLTTPASHCPVCRTAVAWRHNIPVLSWLVLRGRCAYCDTVIPWTYPALELVCALIYGALVWRFGISTDSVVWCLAATVLMVLVGIDLRTQLLPDVLTLSLMWMGLLASAFGWISTPLVDAVLGAATGYGAFWGVAQVYRLVAGEDGMGNGDFKLVAALCAFLGWQALPMIMLGGGFSSAIITCLLAWRGRTDLGAPQPFGPHLALAGVVYFCVEMM